MSTSLSDLTADELRTFARDAIVRAQGLGNDVHVVGFSLGGLLAVWIGQRLAVARATAIAPFLGVAGLPRRLTGTATRLTLASPNAMLWWDPLLRERLEPEHGYPRFATHAVAQASALAAEVLADAAREAPQAEELAIVLNAGEMTVNNRAARLLAWRWTRYARQRTHLYRIRGLGLSHDIIEPLRSPDLVRRLYPPLLDLVAR